MRIKANKKYQHNYNTVYQTDQEIYDTWNKKLHDYIFTMQSSMNVVWIG